MELHFVKLTGAGNDFVGVNNLNNTLGDVDRNALARAVCDRHFGIGGDGLLVIDRSDRADFRMMYYNADGSLGGMCGNGGRCAAFYARTLGLTAEPLRFEANDYVYEATFTATAGVCLKMKDPRGIVRNISVALTGGPVIVHAIDTGSPHVVQIVPDLTKVPVTELGRTLREHDRFTPEGTNVNFVQRLEGNAIAMRTYERGVEAETLACGTGSIASSIIAHLEVGLEPPVRVRTWSGQWLNVRFTVTPGGITEVRLEGPAVIVFAGRTLYDPAT
ncbi:MAG TPA: diaminopimelate epimerase, partial [Bacteroidota bacterium]|nr:diaminopimelate epimerase [Bacteroidota bacterium]